MFNSDLVTALIQYDCQYTLITGIVTRSDLSYLSSAQYNSFCSSRTVCRILCLNVNAYSGSKSIWTRISHIKGQVDNKISNQLAYTNK